MSGEGDEYGSSVTWLWLTFDEASLLECVDETGDVSGCALKSLAELSLIHGAGLRQTPDDFSPSHGQPLVGEPLGHGRTQHRTDGEETEKGRLLRIV